MPSKPTDNVEERILPNTPIIWPEKLPKPNERRTDDGEDSNSKE